MFAGEPPGLHVEDFVFVDFTRGGTVGAADIIGEDFKSRHRVGFRIVAEEEVADFLVGISFMGSLGDLDESGKNGAGGIVQHVVVKEVAEGTWRVVFLQGALIDHAVGINRVEAEHDAAGFGTDEAAEAFAANKMGAEVEEAGRGRSGLIHEGRVEVEGEGGGAPLLDGVVFQSGRGGEVEIIDATGEGGFAIGATEVIDHAGTGAFAADDEGVGEDGGVFSFHPVKDFDGVGDGHSGWDIEEESGLEESLVEFCVFVGAEFDGLLEKVGAEEIFVEAGGFFEREGQHAFREVVNFAGNEAVIGDDKFCGGRVYTVGGGDEGGFIGDGARQVEPGEVESLDARETPGFIGAFGGRSVLKFVPSIALGGGEPSGPMV